MNRTRTAILLVLAAVLANVAFTVLGTVFNYPDVLNDPAGEVLAAFRQNQALVSTWFGVLAASAALLAPIAVGIARLSPTRTMRIAVGVGIAAAAVQVIGLLRWPILVPGFAADAASADPAVANAAREAFVTASAVLGTAIGETLGYLLTAAWTVLVVIALGLGYAGRWFRALGLGSALLVLAGVLSPLGLPVIDTANFVGYILWSAWLIVLAALIVRDERRTRRSPTGPTDTFTRRPTPGGMDRSVHAAVRTDQANRTRPSALRGSRVWTAGSLRFRSPESRGSRPPSQTPSPPRSRSTGVSSSSV